MTISPHAAEIAKIRSFLTIRGAYKSEADALLLNFPLGQGCDVYGFIRVPSMSNAGKFSIAHVPITFLKRDEAYQRGDKEAHQRRMSRNSYKHDMTTITVASRVLNKKPLLGAWPVLDGVQRSGVAPLLNQLTINVDLWLTDTYEAEALLFDILNNVSKVTPQDRLPSRLASAGPGNPYYEMRKACEDNLIKLEGDKNPPATAVRSISTIEKVKSLVRKDKNAFSQTLALLMLLPPWTASPSYELIRALNRLVTHDPHNYKRIASRFATMTIAGGGKVDVPTLEYEMDQRRAQSKIGGKDSTVELARGLRSYLAKSCSTNAVTCP